MAEIPSTAETSLKNKNRILSYVFILFCLIVLIRDYFKSVDRRFLRDSYRGVIAWIYYESNDYTKAVKHWLEDIRIQKEFSLHQPSDNEALVYEKILLGDLQGAEVLAIAEHEKTLDIYLDLADISFQQKRNGEAIDFYSRAIEQNRDSFDAYLGRALSYIMDRDYDKAIGDFKSALRFDYAENRVTTFFNFLNTLDYLKSFDPQQEGGTLWCLKGYMYRYLGIYDRRKLKEAFFYADKAVKAESHVSDSYVTIGVVSSKMGNDDLALRFYTNAVNLDLQNAPAYEKIIALYSKRGELGKALSIMKNLAQVMPEDSLIVYNFAHFLTMKIGDYYEALKYANAIYERSANSDNSFLLGYIYVALGNYDEAIRFYSQINDPAFAMDIVYENLGTCYFYKKDYAHAIENYTKSYLLNFRGFKYYNFLADAYTFLNRGDEAIMVYKDFIRLHPEDNFAHYSLGLMRFKKGEFSSAVASLQKAVELNPNDIAAQQLLGYALTNANRN